MKVKNSKSINVLEFLACHAAFFLAFNYLQSKSFLVINDSLYVKRVLSMEYPVLSSDIAACFDLVWSYMHTVDSIRWEARETNTVCDALAKEAALQQKTVLHNAHRLPQA